MLMTKEYIERTLSMDEDAIKKILSHCSITERAAVWVFDQLMPDLKDPRLIKLANRHRMDEIKHADMLSARMVELGINPDASAQSTAGGKLIRFWNKVNPKTVADKYMVIQVIEERDIESFRLLSEALKSRDAKTADIFNTMYLDEKNHGSYCMAAMRILADERTPMRLAEIRKIDSVMSVVDIYIEPEVYDFQSHFSMIQSWTKNSLDPDGLGTGLVVPDVCCGFVGVVGGTKTAYFYGLNGNPELPLLTRGKAMLRLAPLMIQTAKASGCTRGITSTENKVIKKFWLSKQGWSVVGSGEYMIQGIL